MNNTIFKDTVRMGERYIVLLYSDTDDAIIYALSSRNSVRSMDEKAELIILLEE